MYVAISALSAILITTVHNLSLSGGEIASYACTGDTEPASHGIVNFPKNGGGTRYTD